LHARVKHPATVAENVTAAVDQIIWKEFRFRLKKPIDLSVRRDGAYWLIGYEALGVEGYARSEQAALESFADQFYGAWKVDCSARRQPVDRRSPETETQADEHGGECATGRMTEIHIARLAWISHGQRKAGDWLIGRIAKEIHLSKRELLRFVACEISQEEYNRLLEQRGRLRPPS
jgi:hypothetical protein